MRLTLATRDTARDLARAFVESRPSWRAAAAEVGISESLLRNWVLLDEKTGLRPFAAFRLAEHFGLPLEAIYQKDAPLGQIVRRLRPIVCPDGRRAA